MRSVCRYFCFTILVFLLSASGNLILAESILAKNISVHVNNMRLGTVLKTIEERGNFHFSYNSNIVKTDSLITVNADNKTIKEVLDQMLLNKFEYKELNNFIILRYAPLQLSVYTDKADTENEEYVISGVVTDGQSNKKLENASVFERTLLQSTLTDKNGHFELHLKNGGQPVRLTISKELYKDTTITFLADVKVSNSNPANKSLIGYVLDGNYDEIERTAMGKLFISTRQQIQSANLGGLIAQAPFQASVIPGVSTHGQFSGQVVNTVSLNAIGGYNAGVDGFELGLVYNLDKGNVRSVQIAGVFNVVGGSVSGVQFGGLYNNVLGNVSGFQLALLHNNIKRNLSGVQLSGVYNHVGGKANGVQLAAINNAKNLHGLQIGLINIADTSSGYSLGLINIVKHGYHKLSLSSNETTNANIALKMGSTNFYTMWRGGMRLNDHNKLYSFGLGIGNELGMGRHLALNPELSTNYVYQGNWNRTNLLNRIDAGLTYKFTKGVSLTAGPSLNFFYSDQHLAVKGYALAGDLHHNILSGNGNWTGWIGWTVGLNFF